MIRSWDQLLEFLANGGRLRFSPGENPGSPYAWSDADSGAEIVSILATRALADGAIVREQDDGDVYVRAVR